VATVLATLVAIQLVTPMWLAALVAGFDHAGGQLCADRSGPAHHRPSAPLRHRAAAGRAGARAGRATGPADPAADRWSATRFTPGPGFREGPFSSEVELREVVDMAGARGVVAEDERQMIHSVFELGDTPTRDVMVPRTDLIWIERGTRPSGTG